ncbi:MAG TPA: hypothetical protein VMF35_10140 [Acidimicrobiales bacterium]|nr:hypothetical protein [Acidimicrobiales bacterium]
MSAPEHLNSHHRETLAQIFRHPLSHNLEWHAIVSLLESVGTVKETKKDHVVVTIGDSTETLEVPHNKDIDPNSLANLRRLLRNEGYAPDADPAA